MCSMMVICMIWALQQVGLKSTAGFAAPVFQIGLRSGLAGICVYGLVRARGERISISGRAGALGLMAGLLSALSYSLVGASLKYTTASHAIVFLYTAPIFSALGLHWKVPSERLAPVQWFGIAICTAGIGLAFLSPPDAGLHTVGTSSLTGDGLALMAGIAWGLTTVLIRTTNLGAIP